MSEDSESKKLSTLAGTMQRLYTGSEYLVEAVYQYSSTYGHQYRPIAVYAVAPQTPENQLLFLQSIISPKVAESLIKAYPNIVNDVITGVVDTIDYSRVKGVREVMWRKIKDKIINNYLISDIITLLSPIGVTYTMIKKLLDEMPNPTLLKQEIENNPYVLTRINGLGFKRVDEMALKLKPDLVESVERLTAYIKYFYTEMGEGQGHTWCSRNILVSAVQDNVPQCAPLLDDLLEYNNFLHIDGDRIGLQYYYKTEMEIYDLLKRKSKIKTNIHLSREQISRAVNEAEREQGFEYAEEQLKVIDDCLSRTISLITGKAGCGKTSIMRAIIKAYEQNEYEIAASALSAMAAQRITEATDFPAATIHRTLGCMGFNKFAFNKDNHLLVDVAFMDEGSMVNAHIFLKWLEAIDDSTRIIISGDHKQLPPIGFGNVFSDLIEMLDDDVVSTLTKPMRQAAESGILVDANLIRENINPIKESPAPRIIHGKNQDMYYMFRGNRQTLFDIAVKTFLSTAESEGLDSVAIVVPRKQGCLNSTAELNNAIQDKLIPGNVQHIESGGRVFKLGAKVIQTVNDYQNNVFNGDVGYITEIGKRNKGKKSWYCVVRFKDMLTGENKDISYTQREAMALDLAYALTVHKIQGGSRKTIIGIIDNTHYQLLDNCMLYTLLTRAKERCLLLGEYQAFQQCIRTSHNSRNTWMNLETMKN